MDYLATERFAHPAGRSAPDFTRMPLDPGAGGALFPFGIPSSDRRAGGCALLAKWQPMPGEPTTMKCSAAAFERPGRVYRMPRSAFRSLTAGTPIPGRYWSAIWLSAAGLGWIGKNTCLINPRLGSYFFLAEILLGLDLPADAPFIFDRCGACNRCLQACPTGCILPDRTIDARRCISYLTIELKGAIPPELRPLVGEWVFGCDICQQVCPWNIRFAGSPLLPVAISEFSARPDVPAPDLSRELALSADQFSRKFKGSPVKARPPGRLPAQCRRGVGELGFSGRLSRLW